MKKKIIALIMSIVLCFSLAVPAFAEDDAFGSIDITTLLNSEIVQQLLTSDGIIDLTAMIMNLMDTMNPENLKAMGKEKVEQSIASVIETVGDYLSLLTGNKDLVFTYDPLKVFGNLFDLDTESLTTQNPEDTTAHPDEMVIGLGDVDGDGKVTAADARQILRRAAQLITFTMEQDALADIDKDGRVTATDARIVLRYCANLGPLEA